MYCGTTKHEIDTILSADVGGRRGIGRMKVVKVAGCNETIDGGFFDDGIGIKHENDIMAMLWERLDQGSQRVCEVCSRIGWSVAGITKIGELPVECAAEGCGGDIPFANLIGSDDA